MVQTTIRVGLDRQLLLLPPSAFYDWGRGARRCGAKSREGGVALVRTGTKMASLGAGLPAAGQCLTAWLVATGGRIAGVVPIQLGVVGAAPLLHRNNTRRAFGLRVAGVVRCVAAWPWHDAWVVASGWQHAAGHWGFYYRPPASTVQRLVAHILARRAGPFVAQLTADVDAARCFFLANLKADVILIPTANIFTLMPTT